MGPFKFYPPALERNSTSDEAEFEFEFGSQFEAEAEAEAEDELQSESKFFLSNTNLRFSLVVSSLFNGISY